MGSSGKDLATTLKDAGIDAAKGTVYRIPPSALTIVTDKAHPLYDPRVEDPLDADFVADVRARGIQQTVTICRDGVEGDGTPRLLVVAGRQRVRAAQAVAGNGVDVRVPCAIMHGEPREMVLHASAENAYRRDETILSRAWKARTALGLGSTEEEVARTLRVKRPSLEAMLAYLDLSAPARKVVDKRHLSLSAIAEIAKAPRDDQAKVAEALDDGSTRPVSADDVRDAVSTTRSGGTYRPPPKEGSKGGGSRVTRPMIKEWAAYCEKKAEATKSDRVRAEAQTTAAVLRRILGDPEALFSYPAIRPEWDGE